ncbi:D-glycero-beta-D-manno-heptose-7-phosphate kinase [Deferribacterales bacterium Es71-Z0220]|uniref:D-glycero-beta-D-manno-heptose-7-phosphate kinase n=1 Tax=Deferrivibrio essentukiensis TaxID=2880922 RepID=UPI001F617AA3|nr:D-glycero-beta-D-manno-heptose-7-phosphate kinase [Deferrivibrio essentukiensis]MCB4205175.1 D-glycero-beta-D-manno-heptose-7-phosphate kinase [Deferrivibrio essentukiensis]
MDNYIKIIESFKNLKILVIGDLMLDVFLYGDVERISPEAPVPVVKVSNMLHVPGGAANVSSNLKSLGVDVTLCGVVGDDETGKKFRNIISSQKINAFFLNDGRRTSIKTRVIASNQQVVRYDVEDNKKLSGKHIKEIESFLKNRIKEFKAIIISDYGKGVVTKKLIEMVSKLANENKIPLTVDPKIENFKFYKGVTCITPNTKEASEGSGVNIKDNVTLLKAAKKIMNRLNPETLLITRGSKGMAFFDSVGNVVKVPALAKEVFDVTGAGDTVISVFTAAIAAGANYIDAMKLSNLAGSIVVGKMGTATVTPNELADKLNLMAEMER